MLTTILTRYFVNVPFEDENKIITTLFKTEISTFFYVFHYFLEKNKNLYYLILANNILFISSFFWYRLYEYYYNILVNPNVYKNIQSTLEKSKYNYLIYIGLYGLFGLNMYWFIILCKVLFKRTIKDVKPDSVMQHRICKYTMILNIPICLFHYRNKIQTDISVYADILAVTYLATNSYLYHKHCAEEQERGIIDYEDEKTIFHFLSDKSAIHMRSFICVLTCLFHTTNQVNWILGSYITNSLFWLIQILYVKERDYKRNEFLLITNIFTCIPILLDTFILSYFAKNNIHSIQLFIVSAIIGMVLKIEPLYHYNHVLIHGFLLLQTSILCQCIL